MIFTIKIGNIAVGADLSATMLCTGYLTHPFEKWSSISYFLLYASEVVQLQVREPEIGEEALVQGLRVLASTG